jgi:hypothetical protein
MSLKLAATDAMSVRKRIWKTAAGAIKAKISDSRDLNETYKKESGLDARQREAARKAAGLT